MSVCICESLCVWKIKNRSGRVEVGEEIVGVVELWLIRMVVA